MKKQKNKKVFFYFRVRPLLSGLNSKKNSGIFPEMRYNSVGKTSGVPTCQHTRTIADMQGGILWKKRIIRFMIVYIM